MEENKSLALAGILKKADKAKPTPQEVEELRLALRDNPALWRTVGYLPEQVYLRIVHDLQGSPALKESLKAGWDGLRRELGYSKAPTLERLVIDQVVIAQLQLGIIEYRYNEITSREHTLIQGEYWEKRLTAAQGRFLRASVSLARIRRLSRGDPALQINIAADGGQQVNVAGDLNRGE